MKFTINSDDCENSECCPFRKTCKENCLHIVFVLLKHFIKFEGEVKYIITNKPEMRIRYA